MMVGCQVRLEAIRMLRIRALVLLVVVLTAGALASSARADGDPASDVLVSQGLFVPADAGLSTGQQARLAGFLQASKRAGFPVRVAVIPSAYDLGSVEALWQKPATYARFLGIELSLVYRQAPRPGPRRRPLGPRRRRPSPRSRPASR
jgi:hypothetical protein